MLIDASTPSFVGTLVTAETLTTEQFTPPVNSLLVVVFGDAYQAAAMVKPTNNGGTVVWANAQKIGSITYAATGIWLGRVTVSAPMTVTIPANRGSSQWGFGVIVLTDAADLAEQDGQTAIGTNNWSGAADATIASLAHDNSFVVGVATNVASATAPTPGTNQSTTFNGHVFTNLGAGSGEWAQYDTRTDLAAGASCRIYDTAPTGNYGNISVAEIVGLPQAQKVHPDSDIATTGWSTAPLFSKINDESDATVITGTLA